MMKHKKTLPMQGIQGKLEFHNCLIYHQLSSITLFLKTLFSMSVIRPTMLYLWIKYLNYEISGKTQVQEGELLESGLGTICYCFSCVIVYWTEGEFQIQK